MRQGETAAGAEEWCAAPILEKEIVRYMMRDGVTDGVIARVMGLRIRDVIRLRPRKTRSPEARQRQLVRERGKRFAALQVAWEKRRAEG